MANNERLGASFSIDITDLKAGLAQANRLIKESNSEFQAAAAGMDDWTKSEDGLNAKIKSLNQTTDIQRKKVDALQEEYDRLISDGLDPTSKQAVELRTKINNETAALNKNEAELKQQTKALEDLEKGSEDAGDATEEMGDKFAGLKKAGGIAAGAVAAVGAACVAAVGAFLGLAESTREARENMAKLETGFTTAGHSAEDAEKTYTKLYGLLGDDGQATEAAAHLAQLTDTQEELATWTDIATGVYATFGDSLPIEGLTEAANETAKVGQVTGPLADALNWAGVSEDAFNESLAACSSEQERQALITDTLNGLYSEAADKYKEVNADVLASQEAQAGLNQALNELGAVAEPIMTTLKVLATDLLQAITPFVKLIGEGLTGALNGTAGAADTLAEGLSGVLSTLAGKIVSALPTVVSTLVSVISTVIPSLVSTISSQLPSIISTVVGFIPQLLSTLASQLPVLLEAVIFGISQILSMIGQMLPDVIPIILNAVIMMVETLLDNVDMLIDSGIALILGLADGLISALPSLIDKIPVIIDKLITAITSNLPKLIEMGIQLTVKLAAGIIKAIPQLVSKVPQIISSLVRGLKDGIGSIKEIGGDIIRGLWSGISDMASWIGEKIKGFGETVLGGIKSFFGIKSPSKVMADQVGKNLALGIGEGFEKNIAGVNKEITDAMNFDDASVNVNATGSGTRGNGVTVYQTNNYKQAYTSPIEKYKSKQQLYAAARLIKAGAV